MKLTQVISMGAASATAVIGWFFMSPTPAKPAQMAAAEIEPSSIATDKNSEPAKAAPPVLPVSASSTHSDASKLPVAVDSAKAENTGLLMLQPDTQTHSPEVVKTADPKRSRHTHARRRHEKSRRRQQKEGSAKTRHEKSPTARAAKKATRRRQETATPQATPMTSTRKKRPPRPQHRPRPPQTTTATSRCCWSLAVGAKRPCRSDP